MKKPLTPSVSVISCWMRKKNEAYTTLIIRHANLPVDGALKSKIDTVAGGNTLSLQAYGQIFGSTPLSQVLTPEPSTRLTSYSGHRIPCLESLTTDVRCKCQTKYRSQKLYVVDLPGSAIVVLPTCQLLGLVKLGIISLQAKQASAQPNLAKMNCIEHLCKSCELCQELQPQQPQQSMQMHEKPDMPWMKVGTDLFEIDGKPYLIISDCFSRYLPVKELRSTTAEAVIADMQETFRMLGVPR